MDIRVVAAAHIDSYIGVDRDECFHVISLDDTRRIDCGDVLRGVFDGKGNLFYKVRNVTKREDVRICLEDWGCPLEAAIETLLDFMATRHGLIQVANVFFQSHSPEIKIKLKKAISAVC